MVYRTFQAVLLMLLTAVLSAPSLAQEQGQGRGTLTYLQKEPATLFDMGMKRLRRAALSTASQMIVKPGMKPKSRVSYKHDAGIIEIEFNLVTETSENMDLLRQECINNRKNIILRMLQIGLTDFTTQLSVNERIRRRIGAQFSHEPVSSGKETLSLGEQLGQITYFTVVLTTAADPAISVTCRALAMDLIEK